MQLEAIRLSHFRNYQDASLSFPEGEKPTCWRPSFFSPAAGPGGREKGET